MEKQKRRKTINELIGKKLAGLKISMLTAYDYPFARILDAGGVDLILVGDSLSNVALGYRDTLPVTMEEMLVHLRAVDRAVTKAMVIADMPFGSFQPGAKTALENAIKFVKAGANGVKLEGGNHLSAVRAIVRAGIPVMGHLGFTPQSVNQLGYRIQGKGAKEAKTIFSQAQALARSGCFALVLEMVPDNLAHKIAKRLKIPVIGIGSGRQVDGQVLVTNDLLGLEEQPPRFVKPALDLKRLIIRTVRKFTG